MITRLLFHFLDVEVHSNDERVHAELGAGYRSNDLRAFFPDQSLKLSVHLRSDTSLGTSVVDGHDGAAEDGQFIEMLLSGSPCVFRNGGFRSSADGDYAHRSEFLPQSNEVNICYGGLFREDAAAVVALLFRSLFRSFAMPFYRLKALHAAALVQNDHGFLLVGPDGAGKSTLALHLADGGAQLLADDSPLLTRMGNQTVVLSSLDLPRVAASSRRLFPHLAVAGNGAADRFGKFPLVLRASHDRTLAPATIRTVITLDRAPGNLLRLTEEKRSEAWLRNFAAEMTVFRRLAGRRAERLRQHCDFVFDLLAGIGSEATYYRLRYQDADLPAISSLLGTVIGA